MYMGNPTLRRAGEQVEYTEELLQEYIKCKEDIIYFAEKYFYIVTIDKGKQLIKLYDFQKKILKACQETPEEKQNIICKIFRQAGKTTTFSIFMLHYILFNKDKTVAVLAHQEKLAIEILDRIKNAFKSLPLWLQVGIVDGGWNQKSIVLENGSRVYAYATGSESVTGFTVNILYLDEFAKVPSHIAEEFIASTYPVISSGKTSKIIIASCVSKDAFVFSDKGLRQVKDFIKEDKNKNGKGYIVDNYKIVGKNKLNEGNIIVNNGKTKTRIIKTTFGNLEGSLEHKLWACKNGIYGWYKLKDLNVGDYISVRYGMNIYGDDDYVGFKSKPSDFGKFKKQLYVKNISSEMAYFLGLFLAEGSSYKHFKNKKYRGGSVTITCGDDVSEILTKLNFDYSLSKDKKHYKICNSSLIEFLEYIGFDLTKKAKEKYIPNKLLSMSKKNIIAMLSGFFDGNGYSRKDKGLVGVSINSKKMLMQIKMLLLNLGIVSDYLEINTKITKNYRILLDGENSKKFYKIIGFRFKRKQDNQQFLSFRGTRNSFDNIPFSRQIIEKYYNNEMRKLNIFSGISNAKHLSRKQMLIKKDKLKCLNNIELNRFLDDNVSDDLKWYPIRSIEESENEVYDFSLNEKVDDFWCHSVLYNGIVGHQTPKGMNHYYEFWTNAVRRKNNFYPIRVGWWELPGRDEDWKKRTIADIGQRRFDQEFSCKFLGSSSTLIDSDILERIEPKKPIQTKWTGLFNIYEIPQQDHQYILGIDVGKGVGRDASVIQVLDILSETEVKQVATYRNNLIAPHDFAQVCISISDYYNKANMMIENNDIGQSLCDTIWYEYDCDRIVNVDPKGLGIRSTRKTKLEANMLLKEYMEKEQLEIVDQQTLYELSRYEEITPNVFACGNNENDDCVTSLLWALYFINTDFYEDKDDEIKKIDNKFKIDDSDNEGPAFIIT